MKRQFLRVAASLWAACAATTAVMGAAAQPPDAPRLSDADGSAARSEQALITRYCVGCHNARNTSGNLVLEGLSLEQAGQRRDTWEKVVRKLRAGLMPPAGLPRPDAAAYQRLRTTIETRLDQAAVTQPDPGRTEIAHRLNRFEYANAIRDLLAVEFNVSDLLPPDDSSYGFDNIAGALKTSPALMERYLAAARQISRLAVGSSAPPADTVVYRVSPELQQHDRIDPLPFGTRGGVLVRHVFPVDAEYVIKVAIAAKRSGDGPYELEIAIDGDRVAVRPVMPRDELEIRVPVKGGPHDVAVAFVRTTPSLVEHAREPFLNPNAPQESGGQAGPRLPGVASVTVAGPTDAAGPGDTPSRRRVFICRPTAPAREAHCARTILAALARRAFRAPVTEEQLRVLLRFYEQERREGGSFDAGIELAIRRLLVSPEFLYRIERNAPGAAARYRIRDVELASRLSFFLWSSIPDDDLLGAAEKGLLRTPGGLETQVRRMLADVRADRLMRNFGGQWLQIRRLSSTRPGDALALAFDETLRRGMQRETELLLESVLRENRPVLEWLTAEYTFLDERLAAHYGVRNIQGTHFRRVALPADSPRRGLLGHASILTVTSHAIRTSPVIRGKWILDNILGVPPPDPPPDVPALSEQRTQHRMATMRERIAQHRANPVCGACHSMIDPLGFALENFDAIGRWRTTDESFNPIDASGMMPDGSSFTGVTELRATLVRHPERFVHVVTEKLLTYALGRGLEASDMPAVRKIVRETAPGGYRLQDVILGIVRSYPFQYRGGADAAPGRPSPTTE